VEREREESNFIFILMRVFLFFFVIVVDLFYFLLAASKRDVNRSCCCPLCVAQLNVEIFRFSFVSSICGLFPSSFSFPRICFLFF